MKPLNKRKKSALTANGDAAMEPNEAVVARLLEARRNDEKQPAPAWHYDEQHDIFTYILKDGPYTAEVVDKFFTVFQGDGNDLVGVQLTNLRTIKDCLGLKALKFAQMADLSIVQVVLRTFELMGDGVGDGKDKAFTYLNAANRLLEAPEVKLAELAGA